MNSKLSNVLLAAFIVISIVGVGYFAHLVEENRQHRIADKVAAKCNMLR